MTGFRFYTPGSKCTPAGWDFDKVLKGFFNNNFTGAARWSYGQPAVDVQETDAAYVVEVDLPGYSENDIEVKVEENVLVLASKQKEKTDGQSENEKKEYHLKERRNRPFERRFTLPKDVNQEKISARFKNGVLTLELQKQPKEEPKKINIKIA